MTAYCPLASTINQPLFCCAGLLTIPIKTIVCSRLSYHSPTEIIDRFAKPSNQHLPLTSPFLPFPQPSDKYDPHLSIEFEAPLEAFYLSAIFDQDTIHLQLYHKHCSPSQLDNNDTVAINSKSDVSSRGKPS